MATRTTVFTVAAVTVLGGIVAYAVYFDHKRRNDVEFRKQLRKEQKRVRKAKDEVAASEAASAPASAPITEALLAAALEELKAEPLPTTTQEREAYFSEHIATGELLSQRGPASYLDAALAFYRGLRVYPAPLELIMIYQKTVPQPIFELLMKLTTMEVGAAPPGAGSVRVDDGDIDELPRNASGRASGPPSESGFSEYDNFETGTNSPTASVKRRGEVYYDHFPPKAMNVQVKQVPVDDGQGRPQLLKNVMVATKDFAVGETIYQELPMASALDTDLEGARTHCSQCMCRLTGKTPLIIVDDPLGVAYCSASCKALADRTHHSVLFSLDPFLGLEEEAASTGPRRAAQEAFATFVKKSGLSRALVAMRLFAHQATSDMLKAINPGNRMETVLPEPDDGTYGKEYTFIDHLERLRFLEVQADDRELKVARHVLVAALPSASTDEVLPDEQYNTLKGKIAYNGIGVVYNGGRERPKPAAKQDKEEDTYEWTRTPLGTQRQVGTAIYRVSSYLTHSCTPSVRPTFPNGDYNLHLVASRSIAKGEVLTMAFVEVARQAPETAEACCYRRRKQLAVGWSFVCMCARCLEERPRPAATTAAATSASSTEGLGVQAEEEDVVIVPEAGEVKMEESVRKFEEANAGVQ